MGFQMYSEKNESCSVLSRWSVFNCTRGAWNQEPAYLPLWCSENRCSLSCFEINELEQDVGEITLSLSSLWYFWTEWLLIWTWYCTAALLFFLCTPVLEFAVLQQHFKMFAILQQRFKIPNPNPSVSNWLQQTGPDNTYFNLLRNSLSDLAKESRWQKFRQNRLETASASHCVYI